MSSVIMSWPIAVLDQLRVEKISTDAIALVGLSSMSRTGKLWLVGLVLLGIILRYHGLFSNSFSSDEALFASWARLIAVWQDPLLTTQIVDKPPLLFYTQAALFPLLGATEWAARMPNFIASVLLIPMTGILSWRLFGDEIASILAAAFVTLSPMAIQFSATAYTDPLLTFFLIGSLLAVINCEPPNKKTFHRQGQDVLAGLLFGLAAATKYQAWLFLPLVIGLAIFRGWNKRNWINAIVGLSVILFTIVVWDLFRTNTFSLAGEQLDAYGGLRLAWSWELWSRLAKWADAWSYLFGSAVLLFVFLFAIVFMYISLLVSKKKSWSIDLLLLTFIVGYFILHWFLAIPVWERYLLPLLPIVGVMFGRVVHRIIVGLQGIALPTWRINRLSRHLLWLVPLLFIMVQAPLLPSAYHGRLPIGGQPTADQGAAQIAAALEDSPYGTVLYDHWYSWQWRYHLFDKKVYVSWFPGPDALLEDLTVFSDRQNLNYLVLPNSTESLPVLRALSEGGFALEPIFQPEQNLEDPTMMLFQIDSQQ